MIIWRIKNGILANDWLIVRNILYIGVRVFATEKLDKNLKRTKLREVLFLAVVKSLNQLIEEWLEDIVPLRESVVVIMDFDIDNLKSFIPDHFNLPEIEGNIAEGIVLRMLHHTRRFKKKRDIQGLNSSVHGKIEYFTPEQERVLATGRGYFTVDILVENLQDQNPEHVELWARSYPSRLVGRLLAQGCKKFRTECAHLIREAWTRKKIPFGRYFKPHVQKVVEEYIKKYKDGSDHSTCESFPHSCE